MPIRKFARWLLIAAGGIVVAALALFWWIGRSGSSPIERWVGQQLQATAGSYLVPKLTFDDLDYEYPETVHVKHLRLRADDGGKPLDIIAADEATITLSEIPRTGQPIRIQRIALTKPLFSAIAVKSGSSDFVGFSHLFRDGVLSTQPTERMSDVFQIRLIEIADGHIVYDPRIAGTEPMELDQINTRLAIAPSTVGTYALETKIARPALFDLAVKGNLDLDHFTASDVSMKFSAMLGMKQQTYLPPQLQKLLKDHEVHGAVDVGVSGSLPVMEPLKGNLSLEVALADANLVAGAYRVPLRGLNLSAKLADGKVDFSTLRILPRRGEIDANGSVMLDDLLTASLKLSVKDVFVEDMLRPETGLTPPVAGRVVGGVHCDAPIRVVLAKFGTAATKPAQAADKLPTVWGEGSFDLDQGLLVHLPLVGKVMGLINRGLALIEAKGGVEEAHVDQAGVKFELTGDGARVDQMHYSNAVASLHGNGIVMLDERLALALKGGPKGVGAVSEALATYRVSGTADQPEVKVEMAEGTAEKVENGVSHVENGVSRGLGALGSGIGKLGKRFTGGDDKQH